MNILLITSEIGDSAGGLALTCNQLKSILEELKHVVFIESSSIEHLNITVGGGYDFKLSTKINYSYNIKILSERYKNIDLIIAYGGNKNAYIASILAKKINKKLIIILCGSDINTAIGDIDSYNYNNFALKQAEKVIGLSKELVENSKIIYKKKEEAYEVIPNIYNLKEDIMYKDINFKSIKFGLGSAFLNEKKGVSNLLKSFAKYCQRYNRGLDKLYIFGYIDEDIKKKYQNIIDKLNMQNNIIIKEYLKRDEYLESLEEIDIYIQSSFFEGCCNSVGEAISKGKYIFLSDTGYFSEVLKLKFPEVIIKNLEIEEFSSLLNKYIEILKEKDYRKKLRNYLNDFVNKEIVLEKWKEILKENNKRKSLDEALVVMFHDIENTYTGIDYHRKGFEMLVELIFSKGYKLCSYIEYMKSKDKSNLIICTFDDGYEGVYRNAFPILKKYDFTATVFICPDLIGKENDWNRRDTVIRYHMDLDMLHSLKENNWEIGSHGLGHYNLLRLSQTELEKNLEDSKRVLENIFGEIETFCYPFGDFNSYIKSLVSKYYKFAFSVNTGGSNFEKDKFQFIRLVPEELKKIMEKC